MFTTDGELVWSRALDGPSRDSGLGVALDSKENVMAVGMFTNTVNFGGGPLTSVDGSWDAFVVKYAGTTGAHLFSRRYGGTGSEEAISVAIDSMDNIVVVGQFSGTVDFGGSVGLTAVGNDIFIAKCTLAGAHLWAKAFHSTTATGPGSVHPRTVTVQVAGDVVLTGEFCGTISFGGDEISSAGMCGAGGSAFPWDVFAVRLAGSDGSHVSSVRVASRAEATRMALPADGRLYLIGNFDRFAEVGNQGLTPISATDAFILSLAPLEETKGRDQRMTGAQVETPAPTIERSVAGVLPTTAPFMSI
jgi:hypothetical protein